MKISEKDETMLVNFGAKLDAAKAGFHQVGPIEVERKAYGDSGFDVVWARPGPQHAGESAIPEVGAAAARQARSS